MISGIPEGVIEHNQSNHPYSNHVSNNGSMVADGLDFILNHFEEPRWPRTIFTHTLGRQLLVYNEQEALARFKQANFVDCRINAYPSYTEYQGINRQAPNFIFIDLDKSSFKSDRAFWLAVNKTCKNINVKLSGKPTVLWTGNGVHVYQPVGGLILELESLFSEFDRPSHSFLKFAAQHLSDHKSDLSNNPSFRSCLVRIPGSHNFKCVQRNNSVINGTTGVRVVRYWNRVRPTTNTLLYDFYVWLADREVKNINKILKDKPTKRYQRNYCFSNSSTISWIERLLQTPIDDYRKNAISLILAPYLIKVKELPYNNTYDIIKDWLNKCAVIRQLDFSPDHMIRSVIRTVIQKDIPPMKFETLKAKNKELYDMLN